MTRRYEIMKEYHDVMADCIYVKETKKYEDDMRENET